jgi:signal transduction histidine kinase
MLHEFLTLHRDEIVGRTRQALTSRTAPDDMQPQLEHGVPLFLDQLIHTLQRELQTSARPTSLEMTQGALLHGAELREGGFTLAQVVHGYGDVCQAVTGLAVELEAPIAPDEFKTFNRCLDDAIAQAVTEYARGRDLSVSDREVEEKGFFAHELRNLLGNAILAFEVLKTGTVGVGGSTGAILGRNLIALRDLIDRSLADVRAEAGLLRRRHVLLAELIEEVAQGAAIDASARGVRLVVASVDLGVEIDVDRAQIAAALVNLLQNALKFSRPDGRIMLRTDTTASTRVLIEVEDECGGLPPGRAEQLFRPFEQHGSDRTGLGLGLTIARESVMTDGGEIRVGNVPGRGCIFTIDLPRLPGAPPTEVETSASAASA